MSPTPAIPSWADNGAKRALVDFGFPSEDIAIEVDRAVMHTKPDQLGRQPHEGTEGQARPHARYCPKATIGSMSCSN